VVAGVPPDAFSATGQLWGNPLYDWRALRREGFRWWIERIRRALALFDLVRIDHFRGFVAYWAVPELATTALTGSWRRGPGRALFDAIATEVPGPEPLIAEPLLAEPLIAEDLGVITPAVRRLRDELGLPGMLVLQFGFSGRLASNPYHPSNHIAHRIVYTGTHDHDTARGWFESLDARTRRRVDAALRARAIDEPEPWWGLIRLALSSPAEVSMIQAQDVLGLGSGARMNNPATSSGNWRWRLEPGALGAQEARRLRDATEASGRAVPA
jgi:4-alpha-glucanotransferase